MVPALLHALPPLPADGRQLVLRVPNGTATVVAPPMGYQSTSRRPYDLSQSIPPSMYKEWQDSTYGNRGPSQGQFIVNAVFNSNDRVLPDGSRLMTRDVTRDVWFRWLEHLPAGYEAGGKWPLVIHLHGVGERGMDLNDLRARGPFARKDDLPFVVVAPQCRFSETWQTRDLQILLKECLHRYRVDTARIFLSGNGMGGSAAWQLAAAEPKRFRAVVAPGIEPAPPDARRVSRIRRYEGSEPDPWAEDGVLDFLKR